MTMIYNPWGKGSNDAFFPRARKNQVPLTEGGFSEIISAYQDYRRNPDDPVKKERADTLLAKLGISVNRSYIEIEKGLKEARTQISK